MNIIIIGGGITGTVLALALAHFSRGSIQIDVVEAQEPGIDNHPSFNTRVIALAYGTYRELTTIGIWQLLKSYATPITRIEISNKDYIGKMEITATDYRLPILGYVLELHNVGKQLFNFMANIPSIKLHYPTLPISIRRKQMETTIILSNGIKLNAQLVIAADGSRSSIANCYGIRFRQWNYQQIAVTTNIKTTLPHYSSAFEYFTNYGSLALLPILDGYSSLTWCLHAKYQSKISSWDESQFCYEVQRTFGWRLGTITTATKRKFYPLFLRIAERHITHRLVLVGNAAQTLHPIAGQGFNLSLRDIITLTEVLVQAIDQGEDIGDYNVLKRYQKRRQSDQNNTVIMTDSLVHLFSSYYFPLVVGRNLGLLILNYLPLLRGILVRKILGWLQK